MESPMILKCLKIFTPSLERTPSLVAPRMLQSRGVKTLNPIKHLSWRVCKTLHVRCLTGF